MNNETNVSQTPPTSRGWLVTFSGTGINLALGILYTWSMFKGAIEKEFGWQGSQLNDPYALCCLRRQFRERLDRNFLKMSFLNNVR